MHQIIEVEVNGSGSGFLFTRHDAARHCEITRVRRPTVASRKRLYALLGAPKPISPYRKAWQFGTECRDTLLGGYGLRQAWAEGR